MRHFSRWSRDFTLPPWAPRAALAIVLPIAWLNFLLTAKWAMLPGALNGARKPWYATALIAATAVTVTTWRRIGRPTTIGIAPAALLLVAGSGLMVSVLFSRFPPSTWSQIPFKDDWTVLFQIVSNGVHLLQRGSVVGWNWGMLGGYPTSTDIAQSFAALAFVPMTLLGDRVGYHALHVVLYWAVPVFVWWDLRHEGREIGLLAAAFACFCATGYHGSLSESGDTNSLAGVFSAGLALVGSRAARLGRKWGGPLLMLGLASGLYSHAAFFLYAVIFLMVEALYYWDGRAAVRLAASMAIAGIVALPVHWESLRYPSYVSFNNVVYDPNAPVDWARVARFIYYNVEILAFPHRWFNDYRSLANVWLCALIVMAFARDRSRAGFYASAAIAAQLLLRLNTPEAGAVFDRIQHMLAMLSAPALAGFVLRYAATRPLALALTALIALYPQTSTPPIRHVPDLRAFDPPLIDRIAAADGNMVLVETSPHRDMDSDPYRRSPKTPFDVHFEGLLPDVAGQRFYSQVIDGFVWNVFRGQVVGAGSFRGRSITESPADEFVAEMKKWGVRHLFVWTDITRNYLARSGRFVEQWSSGRWSQFELLNWDGRSAVTVTGSARLQNLHFLGGEVMLENVAAGNEVVVRTNYYPAWRAYVDVRGVPLFNANGQLAFRAPRSGNYVVRLEYPRYYPLSMLAVAALVLGGWGLARWCHEPIAPRTPEMIGALR